MSVQAVGKAGTLTTRAEYQVVTTAPNNLKTSVQHINSAQIDRISSYYLLENMVIQHLHISNIYKKDESCGDRQRVFLGILQGFVGKQWGYLPPHVGHQESEQERTVGLQTYPWSTSLEVFHGKVGTCLVTMMPGEGEGTWLDYYGMPIFTHFVTGFYPSPLKPRVCSRH